MNLLRILYGFVAITVLSSTSCLIKECKDKEMKTVAFNPVMYEYFGMYRPDNWWVYENNPGLNDSLYVYDFTEGFPEDRLSCVIFPYRKFKIATQHFIQGESYISGTYFKNSDCASLSPVYSPVSTQSCRVFDPAIKATKADIFKM